MRKLLIIFILFAQFSYTQDDIAIKDIFSTSLTKSKAYLWLDYLSNQIGGRLSGSLEAKRAVEWGKAELQKLNFDKVWLPPIAFFICRHRFLFVDKAIQAKKKYFVSNVC